jgi:hypothetical protein
LEKAAQGLKELNKGDGGGERDEEGAACGVGKGTIRNSFPGVSPIKNREK